MKSYIYLNRIYDLKLYKLKYFINIGFFAEFGQIQSSTRATNTTTTRQ